MIKWFKVRRLQKRLDALDALIAERSSYNRGHHSYDYLDREEFREYAALAKAHYNLTGSFKYFDAKRHAVYLEPNSPLATTTVGHDHSTTVSYEYGEDGLVYKTINGEHQDRGIEPELFFGSRLSHPELWDMTTEEVVEQLND